MDLPKEKVFQIPLLYTLHCGNLYGTERMALATLEGMREYRRIVFAPYVRTGPSLLKMAINEGYEAKPAARIHELVWALLPIFIRYRRIDVISTSATHNTICSWLARICFVRLRQLNVVHGGGEDRYSYANKHRLNKTRVGLIAVSNFVLQRLLAHDVLQSKVVVIHNFLAPTDIAHRPSRPAFDRSLFKARPIDKRRVRVAIVSRLDPVKRFDVLFQALSTGRLATFHFDVFGTGELFDSYRSRPEVMAGQVTLHGYVPDIAERLAQADVFLHLCPEEPFGLVVLEAFAARLPVIVPASGGTAELVENGVTGLTYRSADSASMTECLLNFMGMDGSHIDSIVEAGRTSLQHRFSASAGVGAYRRALDMFFPNL